MIRARIASDDTLNVVMGCECQRPLSLDENWFTPLQACPDFDFLRCRCACNGSCHWRGWSPRDCAATTGTAGGDSRSGTETSVVVLRECAGSVGVSAEKVVGFFTRNGGVAAEQVRSVVAMDTQGEAELILGGTAKSAGGRAGWLTLGRGVYCCEREEGADGEEKGVHLLGMLAWGSIPMKTNTKDGRCGEPHFIQGLGGFLNLICQENRQDNLSNLFESALVNQRSTVSEK